MKDWRRPACMLPIHVRAATTLALYFTEWQPENGHDLANSYPIDNPRHIQSQWLICPKFLLSVRPKYNKNTRIVACGTLQNPKLQILVRPKLHRFPGTVKTENVPMKQMATGLRGQSGDLLDLTNDGNSRWTDRNLKDNPLSYDMVHWNVSGELLT